MDTSASRRLNPALKAHFTTALAAEIAIPVHCSAGVTAAHLSLARLWRQDISCERDDANDPAVHIQDHPRESDPLMALVDPAFEVRLRPLDAVDDALAPEVGVRGIVQNPLHESFHEFLYFLLGVTLHITIRHIKSRRPLIYSSVWARIVYSRLG
jgi:hypothetical protein